MVKRKYIDKTKWVIKTKKAPLMIIILPNEVDGDE